MAYEIKNYMSRKTSGASERSVNIVLPLIPTRTPYTAPPTAPMKKTSEAVNICPVEKSESLLKQRDRLIFAQIFPQD